MNGRKHLAATFHAVALGALGVIGFTDLQRGVYTGFGETTAAFVLLEFIALALTPRPEDDKPDDHVAYAARRLPGAR